MTIIQLTIFLAVVVTSDNFDIVGVSPTICADTINGEAIINTSATTLNIFLMFNIS